MMRLMLRMSAPDEAGWHGFGAGTFRHLVPYFAVDEAAEGVAAGRWWHGHSDPLQTLVEWGYLGALGWGFLGFGAMWCGWVLVRKRPPPVRTGDVALLRGIMIALAGVGVHSCFDFPLSIYSIHLVAMLLCATLFGVFGCRGEVAAKD